MMIAPKTMKSLEFNSKRETLQSMISSHSATKIEYRSPSLQPPSCISNMPSSYIPAGRVAPLTESVANLYDKGINLGSLVIQSSPARFPVGMKWSTTFFQAIVPSVFQALLLTHSVAGLLRVPVEFDAAQPSIVPQLQDTLFYSEGRGG